jgi:hypothetical protein
MQFPNNQDIQNKYLKSFIIKNMFIVFSQKFYFIIFSQFFLQFFPKTNYKNRENDKKSRNKISDKGIINHFVKVLSYFVVLADFFCRKFLTEMGNFRIFNFWYFRFL